MLRSRVNGSSKKKKRYLEFEPDSHIFVSFKLCRRAVKSLRKQLFMEQVLRGASALLSLCCVTAFVECGGIGSSKAKLLPVT